MMVNKTLVIEVKSNLISGSGEGWSNIIDTDITYDSYGFPCIPARRLKGVLREAALELEEFGVAERGITDELFGNDERDTDNFILHNAGLEDLDKMYAEIRNCSRDNSRYLNKVNVLDYYTDLRYMTAIDDDGIAKENSLRVCRTISKGLKFYAPLETEEVYVDVLKKACRMVRHMGVNRTRGFGEVELNLMDSERETAGTYSLSVPNDDKVYEVRLDLETKGQLSVMSGDGETGLDYIPGAAVLGFFANRYLRVNNLKEADEDFYRLFIKGDVKFLNAYVSDEEWNEYVPCRETLYRDKTGTEYFDKVQGEPEGLILKKIKHRYMSGEHITEVNREMVYHHRRPEDKSVGHVLANENGSSTKEKGIFYQKEVLSEGQRFIAVIRGRGSDLKKAFNGSIPSYIRIGESKNTQYGNVKVVCDGDIKFKPYAPENITAGTDVVCTLLSPLVLLNDNGMSNTSSVSLCSLLNIEDAECYLDFVKTGGYNRKWKLQKPSYIAFAKGSCIRGKLSADMPERLSAGILQNEGNGQIRIEKAENISVPVDGKAHVNTAVKEMKPVATREILINGIKKEIYNSVMMLNTEHLGTEKITPTLVGRLLTMLGKNSWAEFVKDSEGIADAKKNAQVTSFRKDVIAKADDLLMAGNIRELMTEDEYNSYTEELYMDIAKVLLTNRKLEMRASGQGGEQ